MTDQASQSQLSSGESPPPQCRASYYTTLTTSLIDECNNNLHCTPALRYAKTQFLNCIITSSNKNRSFWFV